MALHCHTKVGIWTIGYFFGDGRYLLRKNIDSFLSSLVYVRLIQSLSYIHVIASLLLSCATCIQVLLNLLERWALYLIVLQVTHLLRVAPCIMFYTLLQAATVELLHVAVFMSLLCLQYSDKWSHCLMQGNALPTTAMPIPFPHSHVWNWSSISSHPENFLFMRHLFPNPENTCGSHTVHLIQPDTIVFG